MNVWGHDMETGTLTQSLRETLALFEESGTPRTTTEIADTLDLGRRSTYDRLDRLVDSGHLETKKVGANARVWWRPSRTETTAEWVGRTDDFASEVLGEIDAALLVLDENFEVVWVNETTEQYFGLDREEVLGRDNRTVIQEQIGPVVDDSAVFTETVLATYEDNTYTECFECRVTAGEGREERWLEHRSRPVYSGTYAGGRVELYYDITHRKRSERALEEFERLVDAVEEYAIFTLDTDGYVRTWNPGAEQIKGYDPDEILGEHFSVFYTEEEREAGVPEANLSEAAAAGSVEDEGWRVRADGSRFWANVTITAIREDGELQGYAKVTRDMTERHETEQELRETNAFIESVLNTELDVIYTIDREGQFLHWNDQLNDVAGYTDAEIEEMQPTDFIDDEAEDETVAALNRVFEEGEEVTVELPLETKDGETIPYEFSGSPLRDEGGEIIGLTGIGRNISERKAKERQLERQREDIASELDDMFTRIDDGFYAVDEQFRFTYVNDRAETLLQHSEEELLGRSVWEVFPAATETPAYDAFHTALETQEQTEYEVYFDALEFWVEANVYPSDSGLSIYFRDVTARKEREQQLDRFRRAVETAGHAIYMTEPDGTITYVNPAFEEMTGYSREVAIGQTPRLLDSGEHTEGYFDRLWNTVTAGKRWEEEVVNRSKSGELYTAYQIISPITDEDGNVESFVAIQTDITEQKAYQRRLEKQVRQQEVVTDLGKQALEDTSLDTLFEEASRLVAETLDNEYCKVLDLQEAENRLLLRQGVGWQDGIVGEVTVSSVEDDSQAAYTLANNHPIVVEDLTTESRFSGPELLTDHDVRSGVSVVIGSHESPWGIFGTHDTEPRAFTEEDVNFVQSVANILASAIADHRNEQELIRQREELAALNSINQGVHEITGAVIEQSTREEIEQAACEHLTSTDSYQFAWVGEVDSATQTVAVRAEAGVEGYTDEITISIDEDDEHSKGPTAQALRTGETKVTRDIRTDPDYEPWREQGEQYGFRSSAAIPIVHENTVYGVLNVYSSRPYAFETRERAVISQLGEIIGHAIAATERKQALMSDELVELEFLIPDIFESLDIQTEPEGTITFDTIVPVEEREFLVYGTATSDAVESLSQLAEHVPHLTNLRLHGDGDCRRFEFRASDPPTLSEVASLGGSIEKAVLEDGEYHLTIHLSPSTDVGRIIDTVQETYPGAEMLARRQIERPEKTIDAVSEMFDEALTDRQRAALRAAYHAGFFEWPREVTAETVAESLDIAPATFSQHLRKGEKKVFDTLLSDSVEGIDHAE